MFSYNLLLLTCLFINNSLLLTLAEQISLQQPEVADHINESLEFQAINCYLTNSEPSALESKSVVCHLEEAIEAIESYSEEAFKSLKSSNNELDIKFECLLDGDSRTTIRIMREIVAASKNCNQEALDFFIRVAEHETFQGQFLNQYARSFLENCWIFNLNALPQRFERIFGKLDASLPMLLEDIANRMTIMKEKAKRSKGIIVIGDQIPSGNRSAVLDSLKQLNFEKEQLHQLALTLVGIFRDSLPVDADDKRIKMDKKVELARLQSFYQKSLINSCSEAEERAQRALWFLKSSMNYQPKGAGVSLNFKRKADANLDYQLEIYRICKQARVNSNAIWMDMKKLG